MPQVIQTRTVLKVVFGVSSAYKIREAKVDGRVVKSRRFETIKELLEYYSKEKVNVDMLKIYLA